MNFKYHLNLYVGFSIEIDYFKLQVSLLLRPVVMGDQITARDLEILSFFLMKITYQVSSLYFKHLTVAF